MVDFSDPTKKTAKKTPVSLYFPFMNLHPFIISAKESTRGLTFKHNWKKVLRKISVRRSIYKGLRNFNLFIWWIKYIFMEQDVELDLSLQHTVTPQL